MHWEKLFYTFKTIISFLTIPVQGIVRMVYERLKNSTVFKMFFSAFEFFIHSLSLKRLLVSCRHSLKLENSTKVREFEDESIDELGPVSVYDKGLFGMLLSKFCSYWPVCAILKQIDGALEFAEQCMEDRFSWKVYVSSVRRHLRRIRRNAAKEYITTRKSTYERIIIQAKRRLPIIMRGKKWLVLLGISATPVLQINQPTENLKKIMELTKCRKEAANKRDHSQISDSDDNDSDYVPGNEISFEEQIIVSKSKDEIEDSFSISSFDTSSDDSLCDSDCSLEENRVQINSVTTEEKTDAYKYTEEDNCGKHNKVDYDNDCCEECSEEHSSDIISEQINSSVTAEEKEDLVEVDDCGKHEKTDCNSDCCKTEHSSDMCIKELDL